MAAVPGESDRWPAAPRSPAAGPAARLKPVPYTEAGTGPPGQAAPWPSAQPPAGFGSGSPVEYDHGPRVRYDPEPPAGYDAGPPPVETGSLLLPHAAAEPAAGPPPEPGPRLAPPADPEPAPAFDAIPMPDLSSGLAPEPLAGPEAEAGLTPWAEPGAQPEAGLVPRDEPEPAGALTPDGAPEPGGLPDPGRAGGLAPRAASSLDSARTASVAGLTGPVDVTERAVIGDKLRAPGVWCELAPCISHHIDPAALGEADVRERAVAVGWRHDALGRLTCPACQQSDTRFRGTQAVMRWERDAALTMAALMVAGFHESQRDTAAFADQTAVIPVLPDAVIAPGSSQDPGPPIRDAWSPANRVLPS